MRRIPSLPVPGLRRAALCGGLLLAVVVGGARGAPVAASPSLREDAAERLRGVAEAAAPGPLRLVALGDVGKGNDAQRRVARAVAALCAAEGGCHLGLLLGDNLYPNGIAQPDDPRFAQRLDDVYGGLGFPFLAVLGNHDYGSPWAHDLWGGLGLDERRAEAQLARATRSPWLVMPGRHWRLQVGPVELVGLDTPAWAFADAPGVSQALRLEDDRRRQERALRRWNLEARAPLRIAVGHHPYRSAGIHGDAGRYDGIPRGLLGSGAALEAFLAQHVMGRFDLYLAGHDHGLQDLGDARGTALVVSGAGAEHRPHRAAPAGAFVASRLGFVVVDVEEAALRVRIFAVPDAGSPDPALVHERRLGAPVPAPPPQIGG